VFWSFVVATVILWLAVIIYGALARDWAAIAVAAAAFLYSAIATPIIYIKHKKQNKNNER